MLLFFSCSPGTDSSSSSSGSRDSRSIARRARHKASLSRQETRRELVKSRSSKHSSVIKPGDVHPSKEGSVASVVRTCNSLSKSKSPPPPPSSPFRRGLYYICDNFLPSFFSPRKPAKPKHTSPSIAYSIREDLRLDDDYYSPPQVTFADIVSVDSGSDTFTVTDDSSLENDSPTPYADLVKREREAGNGHHERCGLGLPEGEKCEACAAKRNQQEEWIKGIGREDAHLSEADIQKMIRDIRKEEMKRENDFDLQRRACIDEIVEQEEQREERERRGEVSEVEQPRAANRTRFHPYATARRVIGKRLVDVDPLVAIYADYELQWTRIRDYAFPTFTFTDIPWPVLSPPLVPEDVTVPRVHDFMRLVKRGPDSLYPETLAWKAEIELRKWDLDVFEELVLSRIDDEEEAEIVRYAVEVVIEALEELVMELA